MPSCDRGLVEAGELEVWLLEAEEMGAVFVDGVVAGMAVAGDDAGSGLAVDPTGRPVAGVVAGLPALRRLFNKVLRLRSSVPSSLSLSSFPSLAPSSALGMLSFRFLTSSLIRRVSSSRRRVEDFSSDSTLSNSRRAASKRSVLASSADFKAAVSVES